MFQERTAAKVLGVILTFVSVGMATLGIVFLTCANTVLNGQWYADTICDDIVCDYFREYAIQDVDETELHIDSDDVEDLFSDEFITHLFSDLFTVAFDENAEYDETYYEEYIEDEMMPAVEDISDYRFSAAEKRELTDEILNMFEDTLEENRGYFLSEVDGLDALFSTGAKDSTMIRGIVYIAICVALLGVEIAVYRNKYCVIKNAGLIALISGASTAFIGCILNSAFTEVERQAGTFEGFDGKSGEMVVKHLMYSFEDEITKHMLIDIAVAAVGLVLIIVGSILMRKFRNKQLADTNNMYSNYYGSSSSAGTYNGYYNSSSDNSYGTYNSSINNTGNNAFNNNDDLNFSSNQNSSFENTGYNTDSYTNVNDSFAGNNFSDAGDFSSSSNNSFGNTTQSPWASGTNSDVQSPWSSGTNSDAQSPWSSDNNGSSNGDDKF